jgi:RNA polymerase sigma factor (sigma-70 family)
MPAGPVVELLSDPDFQPALRKIVASVHRISPHVVDEADLFQDVMLRAMSAHEQFKGTTRASLLAWIRTIARNCLMDRVRESCSAPTHDTLDADQIVENLGSPWDRLESEEVIASALAQLRSSEVGLLRARYADGLSFEQIARVLGKTPDAVRQMHHRLLKRLRDFMEKDL